MPTTHDQVQHARTYRGPAEAGAPRLVGLPGVERVTADTLRTRETVRYDTDDRRLAAAGIRLAAHRGDEGVWTLDLPDGEVRVPLAPDAPDPAPVPGELDELVRGVVRDRVLRPAGRVRTTRTVHVLHGASGSVGEVAVDHVGVATFGRSTAVASWTEVTVTGHDPDDALAARLADDGLQPGAPRGEAELDALLRPARRKVRAGKKGSAGEVLVRYLAAQVDRLAAEDLRVRRDEPDSVHQLRVASRRLRSALQAYRGLLDRRRTEPLVDALRELGRTLAPARDAEVLRERIGAGLAALPPELRLGPVQAETTRHFARTEAEARAAVLTELDGERYAALRGALDDLVARPPLAGKASRPAAKELPKHVGRTARRLEKAVTAALDGDDEAVHAARKSGKRLRYATEVARPAVGAPAKRLTKRLKAFQTALGEHQDTVVARDALRGLGATAENGFTFGVLHGADAAAAAAIERDLPGLWAQAWRKRKRERRWLR